MIRGRRQRSAPPRGSIHPEIEQVPFDGSPVSVWQTPASQARIAISPDGWLVAIEPEIQAFEEWELPAY